VAPKAMRSMRLALLGAALLAASCAVRRPSAPAPPLPGTDACVFIRDIYSWDVIDQSTLIIYAPLSKDPYLVKLFAPVPELPFKERIGFESTGASNQLCRMDDLLVRGEAPRRIPIVALRRISSDEAKQLLKPAAKNPPAAK